MGAHPALVTAVVRPPTRTSRTRPCACRPLCGARPRRPLPPPRSPPLLSIACRAADAGRPGDGLDRRGSERPSRADAQPTGRPAARPGARRAPTSRPPATAGAGDASIVLRDLALAQPRSRPADRADRRARPGPSHRRERRRLPRLRRRRAGHRTTARSARWPARAFCVHWATAAPRTPRRCATPTATGSRTRSRPPARCSTTCGSRHRHPGRLPRAAGRRRTGPRPREPLRRLPRRHRRRPGLYGYCTPDDRRHGDRADAATASSTTTSAPSQFPTNTPLGNLQVTVAHEFFHAVQFAYDYTEDGWFMENRRPGSRTRSTTTSTTTATTSAAAPLTQPARPAGHARRTGLRQLDLAGASSPRRFPAEQGTGLPALVPRGVGRATDDSAAARYSLQALAATRRGTRGSLAELSAPSSATANRSPASSYDEGAAYPTAPAGASVPLTAVEQHRHGQRDASTTWPLRRCAFAPRRPGWRRVGACGRRSTPEPARRASRSTSPVLRTTAAVPTRDLALDSSRRRHAAGAVRRRGHRRASTYAGQRRHATTAAAGAPSPARAIPATTTVASTTTLRPSLTAP